MSGAARAKPNQIRTLPSRDRLRWKSTWDPSVKPGDDFWQYAVGGWLRATPLDAQHPENGAFTDLYELNNGRINKLILAYAEKKDLPQGSDGQKIGALHRLYMDSVSRNRMGYEPIMPYLKQVHEVQTRDEALRLIYELDAKGEASISVVSSIRHKFTVYHTVCHKLGLNIPKVCGGSNFIVPLHRPTDEILNDE